MRASSSPTLPPLPHRLGLHAIAPLAAGCLLIAPLALAQDSTTVVITGSVGAQRVLDAPHAVGVVDRDTLRAAGPMMHLAEALQRVPGVVVNDRGNFAQDLQISSRGFGARASFGVRGIRLVADGIPASGPDGQGQVSQFDLAGAQRVEVLRGPLSVLYGNGSGGVISIVSAPVTHSGVEAALDVGSFGLRQGRVTAQALLGRGVTLRAGLSAMQIDGLRPHSAARKQQANLRLGWQGARDTVLLTLHRLAQPAQDPLGLDAAQFALGPAQTAPNATAFDTRKDLDQAQLGVAWTRHHGGELLRETRLAAWAGQRRVVQFLAIPPAVQANPRHGGGVIDLDRDEAGLDARAHASLGSVDLVAGLMLAHQVDARRGFENFRGTAPALELGVTGALRRDETQRADSRDAYLQAEWPLAPRWSASAGVRHGRVTLAAQDAFLANGDDSGTLAFELTNPVLGLRWQPLRTLTLHASAARGLETPTLAELAYRSDGSGGFNDALQPQRSRHVELGVKWRGADELALDVALFEARTEDEIGIASNASGRQSFQNIGRTLRRGLELAAAWQPAPGWDARLAAAWLDARTREPFLTCTALPCSAPTAEVPPGQRLPGVPRASGFAELGWQQPNAGRFGLELRAVGRVAADDRNTAFAPGHGLVALRWQKSLVLGPDLHGELLLRLDNLLDRRHAGSVIVNDANGRHFEPGAPRRALVALRLHTAP